MGSNNNFLITLSNGEYLLTVALKLGDNVLTSDEREYRMEPENKEKFRQLLPSHCQSAGTIVAIEELFEIVVL